jgi:3-oxoacyl-[acyl-carrier protein] reductase
VSALQGRLALVTGAASGFGAGIARHLADAGARVVLADVNEEGAQQQAEAIGAAAQAVAMDVSSTASVAAAVAALDGPVEILVNNAGIGHGPQDLEALPEEEFDRLFAVNAKSVYLTARACVPQMKRRGSGVILNVASTAAVSPRPGLSWYNASKGWMLTATRSMAVELAPFGIRVNALNPVAGDTPLLSTFLGEDTPENRDRFLATIPLGRFSTPDDLGRVAVFLASEEAAMITGVALAVDGGRCV